MNRLSTLTTMLLTMVILFTTGCKKSSDSDPNGGGNEQLTNYVDLNNIQYDILSAVYFVDNNNLTIQFETTEPDVFLYFQGKATIPLGETNISNESTSNNCVVTYCFETNDFLSLSGSTNISFNNGVYTVDANGYLLAEDEAKPFVIHYVGEITLIEGGAIDGFSVGPVFSYIPSAGGNGIIHVYCDNNNTPWTASSNSSWCHLNNASGTGDGSIGYSVDQNMTITDRSAKITFTANNGKTKRAHIIQRAGAYDMIVNPTELSFEAVSGGFKVVNVIINSQNPLQWTASCNASWVHLSVTNGTNDANVQVSVDNNTATTARNAAITFTTETGTIRVVTVNQAKGAGGGGGGGGGNNNYFFSGTPFDNTSWNVPMTSESTITTIRRVKEYHSTPNGGYFTYYDETDTESDNYDNGVYSYTFKNNSLCLNQVFIYEFKGDSIINKIIVDGQEYIQFRCRNNIAFNIHHDDPDYIETITITRYFDDDNVFCIKQESNWQFSDDWGNNHWIIENWEEEYVQKYIITNDKQCVLHFTDAMNMTSDYGSEYTGDIQTNASGVAHGSGTWEYGVNKNIIDHRSDNENFIFHNPRLMDFAKTPMKKHN